ncbi:MAG TPA: hypothetical protein VNF99_06815 [Stellaceae bacterium]|nr:hypothetical protein [Stellaceae bacterium]
MNLKGNLLRSALVLSAATGLAGAASTPAVARVVLGFGFGVPAPWYYAPPPVVYAPPPVVYAAPPVYPAPQPAYVSQPTPNWYYCNHPRGYYPYVASCSTAWQQVPAQPSAAPPHP